MTKNFVSLVGSNFAVQGVRFLTIALLARRLGTTFFGGYSYLILLAGYGFTLVEFGLKNYGIREISQGRGSKQLVHHILKARLMLASVGAASVVGLAWTAFPNGQFLLPSIFFGASLFIDACLVDFVVIAQERLVAQAFANVIQAVFLYLVCFLFVRGENHFVLLSQLYCLSHLIWVATFYLSAQPNKTLPTDINFHGSLKILILSGAPFLAAQLLGSFQSSMDLLLLGQFHFESWLGDYSAALKILAIALGIINALLSAVQPKLARESHNLKSEGMQNLVLATSRMIWIFIVPVLIGSWLFGNQLIFLFFGSKFLLAQDLLRPLSLAFALFCLGLAPMHGIFVGHDTKLMVKIVVTNVLVSFLSVAVVLVLNKPGLVPWSMVFVQAVYMISAWGPYGIFGFIEIDDLRLLALPAILMTIPLLIPIDFHAVIKISTSASGYCLGLILVRFWNRPWAKAILRSAL